MAQVEAVVSSSTSEVNMNKKLDHSEQTIQTSSNVQPRDTFMRQSSYDADLLDAFAGMDENCLLGEATIVKQTKEKVAMVDPPALPQRSSLRASKMLDTLKLNSIESATQSLTTPHDAYLSSEEDASSSADEFSDYDYESSSETSQGSPVRRKSYEDTARLVSVVYSGKPSLVNLPSPRRSTVSSTPDSCSEIESLIETPAQSPVPGESHPPRTSSLVPSHPPAFLAQDPFAEKNYTLDSTKEDVFHSAPRTASRPPPMLNRVQRTFSMVRKRSIPFLKAPGALMSKDDLTIPPLPISTINLPRVATTPLEESREEDESPTDSIRTPVRYSDIMRSAKRHASSHSISTISSPITPATPGTPGSPFTPFTPRKGLLSGLKAGHRKSLKH
ncbi:hypothetical protein KJ359_001603 [Pestalotiopsis sp. 9143b]|nr:hypothetical protein KJ359_001603 [Pestalotiopsis sp. 9143b]